MKNQKNDADIESEKLIGDYNKQLDIEFDKKITANEKKNKRTWWFRRKVLCLTASQDYAIYQEKNSDFNIPQSLSQSQLSHVEVLGPPTDLELKKKGLGFDSSKMSPPLSIAKDIFVAKINKCGIEEKTQNRHQQQGGVQRQRRGVKNGDKEEVEDEGDRNIDSNSSTSKYEYRSDKLNAPTGILEAVTAAAAVSMKQRQRR